MALYNNHHSSVFIRRLTVVAAGMSQSDADLCANSASECKGKRVTRFSRKHQILGLVF